LRRAAFTFARRICIVGAVACFASAAVAAGPKPDFSFKTKTVEISFTLGDKIKADPALAADCLADGKKWATARRIDAEKMHKDSPESFSNGAWTFERTYSVRSVINGRQAAIASLKVEKKKRGADGSDLNLIEGIEPKLLGIGPVSLAPSTEAGKSSGLTFHYAPYMVGSYAEGSYIAFVPWETLKPYLTPEGAAIFGGARPKDDDDGQR
jgi:hypothetical protein